MDSLSAEKSRGGRLLVLDDESRLKRLACTWARFDLARHRQSATKKARLS